MQPCSVRALGDTTLGIPALIEACKQRIGATTASCRRRSPTARSRSASATTQVWAKWQEESRKDWDASPLTFSRLAHGGLGRHQGRGLGAHRQRAQAPGPQALGLRQAVPPSRRRARHLDPDRHLARRRARAPRQEAHRGRHPARRRPDVRRRRAVDRRQVPDPDAGRDAQQPRLLQRLGAPDPHGEAARHRRGQGAYRHGPVRPGAGLRARWRNRWAATAKARSTIRRT